AEVIEREATAELLERVNEAIRLREACDRRRLGDLEADLRGIDSAAVEMIDDEGQELVVSETLARSIYRAHGELLALVRLGDEPAKRVLDHPAIDVRRESVALCGRNELVGRHDLARFVSHAQQQLVVQTLMRLLQGLNDLPEDLEAIVLERIVDARRPLHFAAPTHEIDVVLLEAVDAVAPRFLRGRASAIGGR